MSKEQWFKQFERELADGVPYEQASEAARQKIVEQALDKADTERKREKGE